MLDSVSGVNLTVALNPHLVISAEELSDSRAAVLNGKMVIAFQKEDRMNIAVASDSPFSFGGELMMLRLTLKRQPNEDDELYKLIKIKTDEDPVIQNDAILLSGVSDGGIYNHSVSVLLNEGTALLNGEPYRQGTLVSEDGEYLLYVTDLNGLTRSVHFSVDCTPPVITVSEYDTSPSCGPVTVYASVNEGSLNVPSYTFTENESFTFTATDAAGNRSERTVSVSNIYTDINLSLSGAPAEPTVVEGSKLNTDGWILNIEYRDKNEIIASESVPVTDSMVTCSTDIPGKQEAVLRWKDGELKLQITVVPVSVSGVKITSLPQKLTYYTGEKLDVFGLELTVFYNNNSSQKVTSGFEITGFDSDITGKKVLTVTYGGFKDTFEVNIVEGITRDINRDGFVSADDLVCLRKILLTTDYAYNMQIADVNKDGKVDLRDFVRLKKLIAFVVYA